MEENFKREDTPEISWEEFLEDDVETDTDIKSQIPFTSKEVQDYDFDPEPRTDLSKLVVPKVVQIPEMISYDYIKLKFDLRRAGEANLTFNRRAFMRTPFLDKPADRHETYEILVKNAQDSPANTMELTPEEEAFCDLSMDYSYAKKKYPNSKPFFDRFRNRMGLNHMYVYNSELIMIITGKIVASNGVLGLISWDSIFQALDVIKSTGLLDFDSDAFIDIAEVLAVHVTTDMKVGWVHSYVKAFSSYLPLRTDSYNVLKYQTGYEIFQTGRKSSSRPQYELCIYNKGALVKSKKQRLYQYRIGKEGVELAEHTLRLELRLLNYAGIRKFLAPEKKNGTITLRQLLDCKRKPILEMLRLLEITVEGLEKARGQYVVMYEDETFPTQAEFERMQGLLRMLEKHDYNLDKVRSYIEVETNHKTHSTYFQNKRATLQQYITCYKPRTIALLLELLTGMGY